MKENALDRAPDGDGDVARLVAAILKQIDLGALALPEEYFYASLPLCVIDAVFSIGVTYASTQNTVARWCEAQGLPRLRGPGVAELTIGDFLRVLHTSSPEDLAMKVFGNRQRTSARSGILKAEAVTRFAEVLRRHGVERFGDTEDAGRNALIERDIRVIPGQGSGISFEYFLMLAGSDSYVKADRMICRFIGSVLGSGAVVTPAQARPLLIATAKALRGHRADITPRLLDYGVWQFQQKQPAVGDHVL